MNRATNSNSLLHSPHTNSPPTSLWVSLCFLHFVEKVQVQCQDTRGGRTTPNLLVLNRRKCTLAPNTCIIVEACQYQPAFAINFHKTANTNRHVHVHLVHIIVV